VIDYYNFSIISGFFVFFNVITDECMNID